MSDFDNGLTVTGTLSGGTSGTGYSFSGTAPAGSLSLNSSGNLGIGKTPSTPLDMVGTFRWASNTGGTDIYQRFTGGAGLVYEGTTTATSIAWITNGGERMRLDTSGNLGVGVTPVSKLHVEGSSLSTNFIAPSGNVAFRMADSPAGATRKEFTIVLDNANNLVDMQAIQQGVAARDIRMQAGGGNLGLGVTPSPWWSGIKAIDIASGGSIAASSNAVEIYQNSYYDAVGFKYRASSTATRYEQSSGAHKWFTAPSGTAGAAITFTQSLAVGKGTALTLEGGTSTTGTGIAFPAAQVASADPNTLDDYEEGTWTPTLNFVTAGDLSVTYTAQSGRYTKVGNMVTFAVRVVLATFSHSTASGALRLTNLPFTPSASGPHVVQTVMLSRYTKAGYTQILGEVAPSDTNIYIAATGSGQTFASVVPADLPSGTNFEVRVSGHYFV